MSRSARRFYRVGFEQRGAGLAGAFRTAVDWIAENDEPGDVDPTSVDGYTSTLLVADVFKIPAAEVAELIVIYRKLRDGVAIPKKRPGRRRFYCPRCLEYYIAVPDLVSGRASCPRCGK